MYPPDFVMWLTESKGVTSIKITSTESTKTYITACVDKWLLKRTKLKLYSNVICNV